MISGPTAGRGRHDCRSRVRSMAGGGEWTFLQALCNLAAKGIIGLFGQGYVRIADAWRAPRDGLAACIIGMAGVLRERVDSGRAESMVYLPGRAMSMYSGPATAAATTTPMCGENSGSRQRAARARTTRGP